jgi:hypothetical protein
VKRIILIRLKIECGIVENLLMAVIIFMVKMVYVDGKLNVAR